MELRPGYKQTEVGVIPEDWSLVLLDLVAKRGSGHTPDKKHPEYWDGEVKWISLKDSDRLDVLYINDTAARITPAGIANSSATMHPAGTVVLSRDAGVGKSSIMEVDMAVSQHFMAWQCGPRLNNIYLYYRLQLQKPEFERIAMGNTIKTIGLPFFKSFQLSLPSIDEQCAIATALSDVDALISRLDRLITKQINIKQATMQQLLSGKQRLPGFSGEWGSKSIKELVQIPVTDGPHSTPRFLRDGIPFLSVNNLVNNKIDLTDLRLISQNDHEVFSKKCKPVRNDLLLGKAASVGKVAIVEIDIELNIWSPIALIRINNQHIPKFFYYCFQTSSMARQIEFLTNSSSQGNIGMGDIEKLVLPVPSQEEQTAIATVLSDIDAEITALEARRDKSRALKQGMMQELLTGRIRLV